MTIDDENSVYVGGLPYNSTEEELRRVFSLYGSIVDVKIVNDRDYGGKCYGFVTFTNPRSTIDAISDMNGRTIGGRVVRVNEVRTRAGRPNIHRENIRRGVEWEEDRDRYRDRSIERFRDQDREREYERGGGGRGFNRGRNSGFDRGRDRSELDHGHSRDYDRDVERDHGHLRDYDRDGERDRDLDWDQDREVDKRKSLDEDRDKDMEEQSRNRIIDGGRVDDRRRRGFSSNSSDEYHEQAREDLDISTQRREELEKEIVQLEGSVKDNQNLVSDLQKKSQKLEDALVAARKLTSQRQSLLTKLHKCFLQSQDYNEKLKSSEQELKLLTDMGSAEINTDGDASSRGHLMHANGEV